MDEDELSDRHAATLAEFRDTLGNLLDAYVDYIRGLLEDACPNDNEDDIAPTLQQTAFDPEQVFGDFTDESVPGAFLKALRATPGGLQRMRVVRDWFHDRLGLDSALQECDIKVDVDEGLSFLEPVDNPETGDVEEYPLPALFDSIGGGVLFGMDGDVFLKEVAAANAWFGTETE